jgi:hypothetical protein
MTDDTTTNSKDIVELEPVTEVKLERGAIAIVFIANEAGIQAAIFDNMEENKPSVLIPLVRGIIAQMNEQGGADLLIKKGVDAIVGVGAKH